MINNWRDPSKDKPNEGEQVLIRETYKNPRYGTPVVDLSIFTYSSKYDFEYHTTLNKNLLKRADYRITHWMRISVIKGE